MKKFVLSAACILAMIVILTSVANSEGELKEGKWTMTMVTKVTNMEGFPSVNSAEMSKVMGAGNYDIQNGKISISTPKGPMQMPVPANIQNNPGLAGIEMHGGWGPQGMTMTMTKCITKEDAMPDTKLPANCERTQRREGNTVYYHVSCNQSGSQMEQDGELTYTGDTMQGVSNSHTTVNGKSIDGTMQITGQYLGPCS